MIKKQASVKFLNHMIALLKIDIDETEEQANEGLELAKELLPLLIEELINYQNKLELFN